MADRTTHDLPKKQQQIITTAEELFYKHGIKRVTVEEICREANVSKMTFYKYFTNKTALARFIWQTWMDAVCAKLDEFDAMDIPISEKFQYLFEVSESLLSKMDTEFVKDFILLVEHGHLEQVRDIQRFRQIITKAQQRGEIRPEIRPEFLLAIHEKFHELMHDEELLKLYPDYPTFQREMLNFFCYGILTKP